MLLLPVLLNIGCFSTIAPDRDPSNTPGGGGDGKTWIRGQVRNFLGEGNRPLIAGIAVEVVWLSNGVQVEEDNAKSDGGGNFSAFSERSNITHVRLRAFKCDYDPDYPAPRFSTCCDLEPDPPCACESPWDTEVMLKVVPGNTLQRTLTISCSQP